MSKVILNNHLYRGICHMLAFKFTSQLAFKMLSPITKFCLYQNIFETSQDTFIVWSIGKLFFTEIARFKFLLLSKLLVACRSMFHFISLRSLTKKFNIDILRILSFILPHPKLVCLFCLGAIEYATHQRFRPCLLYTSPSPRD